MYRITQFCLSMLLVSLAGFEARAASGQSLAWHVDKNGSAVFYTVQAGHRIPKWTVSCRNQRRGCVARGKDTIIWSDRNGNIWLRSSYLTDARVSVQVQNRITDLPHLFSRPVTDKAMELLAQKGSVIVIEQSDGTFTKLSVQGIEYVASYLAWLGTQKGLAARDAAEWPGKIQSNTAANVPETLQRFHLQNIQETTEPAMLVPVNKPQIEFAVRAQGGQTLSTTATE